MPKIQYEYKNLSEDKLALIAQLDNICQSYAEQGYDLTLRGIYYQCVTRDLFPDDRTWSQVPGTQKWVRDPNGKKNAEPNYKWLGDIVTDARMAGLIDWEHMVDRTRSLLAGSYWERPSALVEAAAQQYQINKWLTQPHYVECWVEKQGLEGVLEATCSRLGVPLFACKGYTSLSSMWMAAQRLLRKIEEGKEIHIIHMGDHDPSGIDMSRDIKARLNTFVRGHCPGEDVHVLRIALNMPQIERLNIPPDPAKLTDSRAAAYVEEFGESSWELDALEPAELNRLLESAVLAYRDEELWAEQERLEEHGRTTLKTIGDRFLDVCSYLRGEVV